ncbi:hypothetical protein KIPB_013123, partial [Kipferlia bialata]
AKDDLVRVMAQLEAHWVVLEAELVEINKDIQATQDCQAKYGDIYARPLEYMRQLKEQKKGQMRQIIESMEAFQNNLISSQRLVKRLELTHPPVSAPSVSTISVPMPNRQTSPILAHTPQKDKVHM